MKNALILVDIQNDFMPGGSLAVEHADQILPIVNDLLECSFDFIIATKDWHPIDHSSFALNHQKTAGEIIVIDGFSQTLWPVHCVQNTWGSEFALGWKSDRVNQIIYKGTNRLIDSYSTFFDNERRCSTQLEDYLRQNEVEEVYVAGLATDYCVKYSVLDALAIGFRAFVVIDACRGVNLTPTASDEAIKEMRCAGAELVSVEDVYAKTKR